MSDWNPEKYLLFKNQRTQPARDLARRVCEREAASIVDIGCGPGNSTAILKATFPKAALLGIDSSKQMIQKARQEHPEIDFLLCGAQNLTGEYDLLFSNACLQWIPDHATLIPGLMRHLTTGGTLAVEIPMNQAEPLYEIIKETASEPRWNLEQVPLEKNEALRPEEYYDILSACSGEFELWETVYYHALPSHESLIDWVRSARLRPYLQVLSEEETREFEREILVRAKAAYAYTQAHEVILKFRRFFFTAKKQ